MTTDQIKPRIILLYGPGQGKTYIGNLLMNNYLEHGISCHRYFYGDTGRLSAADKETDYIIFETSGLDMGLMDEKVVPWQRIYFGPENRNNDINPDAKKTSCEIYQNINSYALVKILNEIINIEHSCYAITHTLGNKDKFNLSLFSQITRIREEVEAIGKNLIPSFLGLRNR